MWIRASGWTWSASGGDSQVVLDDRIFSPVVSQPSVKEADNVLLDVLAIPAYAAVFSILTLIFHLLLRSKFVRRPETKPIPSESGNDVPNAPRNGLFVSVRRHIESLGGAVIVTFRLCRLIACLALLGLTLFTALRHKVSSEDIDNATWLQIGLCGVYGYASALALISVLANPSFSRLAVRHLALLLPTVWLVFAYRDLWPFATFTIDPVDAAENGLLWAKMAVLTVAAIIIPLCIPRQYVPIDPKDPAPEPNPEQTASLLSMMLYNYLDPIIFLAYRVPHLAFEQLPPLSDSDYTKNLVARSFPHLDPFVRKSKRHLFFGLMKVFFTDYIQLALMLTFRVVTSFASPLGINRLLAYMETGGKDAVVRPWLWISWLFVGPLVGSIAIQWYVYVATRMMVRTQGIITQLVFDHALRIRVKAETSESTSAATTAVTTPAAGTPDTVSIAEPNETSSSSNESGGDTAFSVETNKAKSQSGMQSLAPSENGESKTSEKPAEKDPKEGNLVGKINNLVSTDLDNIVNGRDFLFIILYAPLQTSLCVWFLYAILGWSAFTGLAVMVVLFPVPGYIASLLQKVQVTRMKKTDARVQEVTETMNVIRMIKLFGWEPKVNAQLGVKRAEELAYIRKFKLLELLNGNINYVIPIIVMIVTFVTYTLFMGQILTASTVFSSMAVFNLMRDQLHIIFDLLPAMIQAKVSLDRVHEFLYGTELLDIYTQDDTGIAETFVPAAEFSSETIGFRNASFTWSCDNDGSAGALTPGSRRRNFTLRIEDELTFQKGSINLIVGPTGSGKTSLLMALLGEMHYIPSGPQSYFNLPREGGVAYATQESWVQNETIRDNILFGAPFDEERYNKVIDQCGLARDLTLFEAGDKTEVGEKGLTLSGGQKARITLARAIYSSAQTILLDDVLAALDVHTARWIVENCLKGDLIQGRTVLLVTHNVAMASPIADFVVSLSSDGRISSQGSLSKALAQDKKLSAEVKQEMKQIEQAEHAADQPVLDAAAPKSDGKLIVAEEISEGHVSWSAMHMWLSSMGGRHDFLYWIAVVGGLTLCFFLEIFLTWFLGFWARQYEVHEDPLDVDVVSYLTLYSLLTIMSMSCYCIGYAVFVFGCLRASRLVHDYLVSSVLSTTLRWLDMTPTSRIITRCTQDIQAVDSQVAMNFGFVMELTLSMLLKFGAVVFITPSFLLPGILVGIGGAILGQIYIKAQLSVKREMSNARAPVVGHFGAAIAGLPSIRAYGAQTAFRAEAYSRIDRFTRAARTFYNLNRWICIRIDALGGLFAAALAAVLVYGSHVDASNTGFSLTMAVSFSSMILWWVRLINEFEVSGNSLERIQQYLEIEQEPKPTELGVPPAYWPASGNLTVNKLSARYSPDGPKVLHDISFQVQSGERVGIVGRTGSGKSSLTLSLLRCILTEGNVLYDGLSTSDINLDALRSSITIIPQVPELLSGTLRQNLDPFSQHDDAVLNDALRAAGLFSLQEEAEDGRITLDSSISSGGSNLSVGQRQILALARAIVRQSKLLILDEATSAIDYETDTVIQSSLRKELGKDVTLLTVAHRLQTIMDADKIMVLDAGRIVEFGKPSELLQNEDGILRGLVDESGDKDKLYAMANQ